MDVPVSEMWPLSVFSPFTSNRSLRESADVQVHVLHSLIDLAQLGPVLLHYIVVHVIREINVWKHIHLTYLRRPLLKAGNGRKSAFLPHFVIIWYPMVPVWCKKGVDKVSHLPRWMLVATRSWPEPGSD